ncbi:MAG: RIP metalloprotease RseP [Termitinemataceae bacterium]|nr:MAG: RIP metalloprotease RseP [Termitinemataceae bacterium]
MQETLFVILKILAGLAGLGIVVFVHELGHFLAARAMGINVEAFSLGWGKPVLKKKIGDVEYRLGIFPVGGYCKMAGDNSYEEAWKRYKEGAPPVSGTWFSSAPWRRIITAFSGPLFNIIFAILVFSVVWGIGFEYEAMDTRIALAKETDGGTERIFPAEKSGLITGDRILSIDEKPVETFFDIQRIVTVSAEKKLRFEIERGGEKEPLLFIVEPELKKENGAGFIGVRPGGELIHYKTPNYSIFGAIAKGSQEAFWMLDSTLRGLRLLFRGIDLTQSVSGPARITWMAGEVAAEAFSQSIFDGLRQFAMILALISIALGVTNLLPLPVLDGGTIILFIVEQIIRRPMHPKVYSAFQTAGALVIAGLMVLALTGDIMFFAGK